MTRRVNYFLCLPFLLLLLLVMFNAGCGGTSAQQPDCSTAVALGIVPSSGSADHAAASPGNKVSFFASDVLPQGCIPRPGPIRHDLHWTVSDTTNTTIGNTPNVDDGLATCANATPAPVTVTATGPNERGTTISGTATLTCR